MNSSIQEQTWKRFLSIPSSGLTPTTKQISQFILQFSLFTQYWKQKYPLTQPTQQQQNSHMSNAPYGL